jgi:hypothetical protein
MYIVNYGIQMHKFLCFNSEETTQFRLYLAVPSLTGHVGPQLHYIVKLEDIYACISTSLS